MTGAVPVVACDPLPEGNSSDKGVERVQVAVTNLLELPSADFDQPKAKAKQAWLDDLNELVDPGKNPGAYRLCQDAAEARGVVATLLGLARRAPSDGLRNKAAEVLARLSFGNERVAAAIVDSGELLPTLERLLGQGNYPERLWALQLAQAIAASPAPQVTRVVQPLVAAVLPQLEEASFDVIPQAALEVIISASFHDPGSVASTVPLPLLASTTAEDAARPRWLPKEPLHVLTCGLLSTNILEVPLPATGEHPPAEQIRSRLAGGHFMENLVLAVEAAANRCEWPPGSSAFHSPTRLADTVSKLGLMGHSRRLLGAVGPLAKIVETSTDSRTTQAAIRALGVLGQDIAGLEAILALDAFRDGILELLHQSGDEREATELVSYLASMEVVLSTAQATLEASRTHITHAPSVRSLAEAFGSAVRIDAELRTEQLWDVLRLVPIGPSAAVGATFSGGGLRGLSFQDFAYRVYGTPTILGWWPSLMEDTAARWAALDERPPLLPDLRQLMEIFEAATHGASGVSGEALLGEVLPVMGLPVEGAIVEELFAEIRGEGPLEFPQFAEWCLRLCTRLQEEALAGERGVDAAEVH